MISIALAVCLVIALAHVGGLHWRLGRAERAVEHYRGIVAHRDAEIGRLRTRLVHVALLVLLGRQVRISESIDWITGNGGFHRDSLDFDAPGWERGDFGVKEEP